jgi:transposase
VVACGCRRQSCAGEKGGSETGPSPVDRGRNGSKHHLLVDANGTPLAWALTGGNRHDVTQLIPLLDRVPPVAGLVGRPRRRPDEIVADRGYDFDKYRRLLRARGIRPVIARRSSDHGSGLGNVRWVVERSFAHLHQFKRLLVRYERRAEMHEAMLALGCCLLCLRRLNKLILQ